MPFTPPTKPGHVFVGYRGVSDSHYLIMQDGKIAYTKPPAAAEGASAAGAGIYVTNKLRKAFEHAKDSAFNYWCSQAPERAAFVDPTVTSAAEIDRQTKERTAFEQSHWAEHGKLHAVYLPVALAGTCEMAFTLLDPDHGAQTKAVVNQLVKDELWGCTMPYDGGACTQTLIKLHLAALLHVEDITSVAIKYHKEVAAQIVPELAGIGETSSIGAFID